MGKVIKQLREERRLTQSDLAKTLNVSPSTIGMWENNVRSPNEDTKEAIADYFNVDMNYLYGKTLIRNSYRETENNEIYSQLDLSFGKLPLYDDLCCGDGMFNDDNIIEYITVPSDGLNPNLEYFCQRAKGDSMTGAGIIDGDILVFEKTNVIDDGCIGAFCVDENTATCKKIKKGKEFIQLLPMNSNYDPIIITLDNYNFRIVGKLKKVVRDVY
ncbi:MAG: helix-turn-helix domain-containing protein [Coprobacillus sp.]|nr:helix-turn-helix domain-containing protein [Coprobacillus sp.]